MSEFLSPKQASRIFGVCPNTLRTWEETGKIIAQKTLGGHRRYNTEEIKRLLSNKQNDTIRKS